MYLFKSATVLVVLIGSVLAYPLQDRTDFLASRDFAPRGAADADAGAGADADADAAYGLYEVE